MKLKCIIPAIMLVCCSTVYGQWAYKGLRNVTTNQLTITGDTVYASTSDGLYKKHIESTDTLWEQVSFAGSNVINCLFLDEQECLLELNTDNTRSASVVFRSYDKGNTATVFSDTANVTSYTYLNHLAAVPGSKDTIFLLPQRKKTFDGGITWLSMEHMPQVDNFIYLNPENSGELFIGGETGYFSAMLQRSADNGISWDTENTATVFDGDNALTVMHIVDGQWYASGEGILVKREEDTGNWTRLLNAFSDPAWGLYMFGFGVSPANDSCFYLSGTGNEAPANTSLRLLTSDDRGITWDSLSYNEPGIATYSVKDLKLKHSEGRDQVWLAGKGVFTYSKDMPTPAASVSDESIIAALFPNPATDNITLSFNNKNNRNVTTDIFSYSGSLQCSRQTTGSSLTLPVENLAAGLYLAVVRKGTTQKVLGFVKQ